MRALAMAGILGLFGLTAAILMRDAHSGRGYHIYYVTPDGNIDISSSKRYSLNRHK